MNSKRFKFEHFTCNKQKPQSYEVQFLRYRVRQNFLSCWVIFCPLTLLTTQKIKIWKKLKKKTLEILSFYTCAPQMTIIWYMVPQTLSATDRIFCHFGLFFCPFTLLAAQKIKMSKKKKKNEKNTWRYHHFKHVCQNLWLDDAQFLRYGARQMDRQTNGRTEKMTQAMSCNWTHNIFHEL